jgi:hypothetical protein
MLAVITKPALATTAKLIVRILAGRLARPRGYEVQIQKNDRLFLRL